MLSFSFSVFGYTPDTVFGIEGFAKGAVALSSVTAGIGICVDAWFLATYSSANAQKFKVCPASPHLTRPGDHAYMPTLTRAGARHRRLLLVLLLLHRIALLLCALQLALKVFRLDVHLSQPEETRAISTGYTPDERRDGAAKSNENALLDSLLEILLGVVELLLEDLDLALQVLRGALG